MPGQRLKGLEIMLRKHSWALPRAQEEGGVTDKSQREGVTVESPRCHHRIRGNALLSVISKPQEHRLYHRKRGEEAEAWIWLSLPLKYTVFSVNFFRREFSEKRVGCFLPSRRMRPQTEIKLGFQNNLKSNAFYIIELVGYRPVQVRF